MRLIAEDVDSMNEEEARDLLKRIIDSLDLAQDEGAFGLESWQGFLEIEV